VGGVVSIRMLACACDGATGSLPMTATVCVPSLNPAGIFSDVIVAAPLELAVAGEPATTVPSTSYVIPSPGKKPVIAPVVVAGNGGPNTLWASVSVVGPVSTTPLCGLCAPSQLAPIVGVTVE